MTNFNVELAKYVGHIKKWQARSLNSQVMKKTIEARADKKQSAWEGVGDKRLRIG